MTGGDFISVHILNFLKTSLDCPIVEFYGLNETTGISFMSNPTDKLQGHVGGPTTNIEFKLVDIEDMHFFKTNTD